MPHIQITFITVCVRYNRYVCMCSIQIVLYKYNIYIFTYNNARDNNNNDNNISSVVWNVRSYC